jgi:hypothetical protein
LNPLRLRKQSTTKPLAAQTTPPPSAASKHLKGLANRPVPPRTFAQQRTDAEFEAEAAKSRAEVAAMAQTLKEQSPEERIESAKARRVQLKTERGTFQSIASASATVAFKTQELLHSFRERSFKKGKEAFANELAGEGEISDDKLRSQFQGDKSQRYLPPETIRTKPAKALEDMSDSDFSVEDDPTELDATVPRLEVQAPDSPEPKAVQVPESPGAVDFPRLPRGVPPPIRQLRDARDSLDMYLPPRPSNPIPPE